MKIMHLMASGALATALLAGCATANHGLILDAVGPGPATGEGSATNGTLMVYSAYLANADFSMRDPYRHEYSDYRIYTPDGVLLQAVHNNSGTILQRPQRIDLAPGDYRVLAQANGFGLVTVPVTLQAGLDTIVHLEGGYKWPNQFGASQTNAVRLPDGEIVGWRGATK